MVNNTGSSSFGLENHTDSTSSLCQTLQPFLDIEAREGLLPDFYIVTVIAACMFNVVTACITLALNAVVILATWLTPSLRHKPKNILLCLLAVSDFFVGFSSQPSLVIAEMSLIFGQLEQYCYAVFVHFYTSWIFSGISFLTLSAIIVERYLALRFHLRYTELITTGRVISAVIIYWVIWVATITILWFGVRNRIFSQAVTALCILTAMADGLCYFLIFKTVRRHKLQMQQTAFHQRLEMARYRRTTKTIVLLVCTFGGSYLPFVITTAISALQGKEDMRTSAAHCMAVSLVSASSCVNPIIYFWRVSEFREAGKRTLRKVGLM